MRECTRKVLAEASADFAGEGAGLLHLVPEVVRILRQPKGFELGRTARPVRAHQNEVSQVRYKHQPVAAPVAAHLLRLRGEPRIVLHALHLDDPTLRDLSLPWPALLDLTRRVEGVVRVANTLIGPLENAEDLGLEPAPDRCEEVRQRRIVGALPGPAARCAHPAQIGEIRFRRRDQLPNLVRSSCLPGSRTRHPLKVAISGDFGRYHDGRVRGGRPASSKLSAR